MHVIGLTRYFKFNSNLKNIKCLFNKRSRNTRLFSEISNIPNGNKKFQFIYGFGIVCTLSIFFIKTFKNTYELNKLHKKPNLNLIQNTSEHLIFKGIPCSIFFPFYWINIFMEQYDQKKTGTWYGTLKTNDPELYYIPAKYNIDIIKEYDSKLNNRLINFRQQYFNYKGNDKEKLTYFERCVKESFKFDFQTINPLIKFYKDKNFIDNVKYEDIEKNFIKRLTYICASHQPSGLLLL